MCEELARLRKLESISTKHLSMALARLQIGPVRTIAGNRDPQLQESQRRADDAREALERVRSEIKSHTANHRCGELGVQWMGAGVA